MKQRILLFLSIFVYFVIIFLFGKILFFLIHSSLIEGLSFTDLLGVLYHGSLLDSSTSGYLTVIPALVIISSIWIARPFIIRFFNIYYLIISVLIAIITVVDIVLYSYWGFHLDSSVFLYLKEPEEAFASVSFLEIIGGTLAVVVFSAITYIGYVFIIKKQLQQLDNPKNKLKPFVCLLLFTVALFIPIRGGVTVSTMNVGQVYFSERMFLNHAAINPSFNLFYSLTKSDDFASQYQFFDKEEAQKLFDEMNRIPKDTAVKQVLNNERPNVILFILESFSFAPALDSVIAPNMSRYALEGVFFENFYANSFRTDRGLVSVLSGYPAQPTAAIMKYPKKSGTLPAIPKSLRKAGYNEQSIYYGGDVDFANMRSYFVGSCGINNIIADDDYPLKDRLTKWGVPDGIVLDRLYNDLMEQKHQQPFFKMVLTLSSHEPFDVPINKFDEPFLNSINYADKCLGNFVERLKDSELWDNTLIIFVADHATQAYPYGMEVYDKRRFHIPMIWIGGAVKEPMVVSDYGSQNDLAATLLSQLDVDYSAFRFSKDMFSSELEKFAFFSYSNGFGMINTSDTFIYDNDSEHIIKQADDSLCMEKKAKAFFQTMYLDLGSR
ncbi:alkaline phosphatase family protein [Dysgonomonas sp. 216]|uniref:LTA synthase family protein n=1 Tax=Dysgonomonas sp. 216 TaxID=2302934 RepID=UPI0013D68862|nr:alkaline phosphatase family protein [Dysgonomonas sp. 216]NDW17490.1 alkaline phosphatase family protein [Dysgonomonas sp. 216]